MRRTFSDDSPLWLARLATTTKAKNRKRERIVKAALEVFSQKGYHRTKVRDITDSIGISTGTFYIYFKNKSDLFVEEVDDVIRSILGDATVAIRSQQDIVKRMEVRGRVFYERYSRYNEILHQLRAEMAGEDRWPQERIKKAYHDLTRPVIRDIQKGIDEGLYRDIDPDLLAYALTGIVPPFSIQLTHMSRPPKVPLSSFCRMICRQSSVTPPSKRPHNLYHSGQSAGLSCSQAILYDL